MNVADSNTGTTGTNEVTAQRSHTLLLRLGEKIPFLGIYFAILSGLFFTASKLGTKLMPTVHPIMIVSLR